jgi:hypothetical protein
MTDQFVSERFCRLPAAQPWAGFLPLALDRWQVLEQLVFL